MFWENFYNLCKEKAISATQACIDMGFSNATATVWKKGTIPNKKSLETIAKYFNVTIDELLNSEESTKLTEQEKLLISKFRKVDEEGKYRIIELAVNIQREQEKKSQTGSSNPA